MMVATLADTSTELLLIAEHDLAEVLVIDEHQDRQTALLLKVAAELSDELQQAIAALASVGVQRAQRVVRAYVAARAVFENPPPKAKVKIAARVLPRLLRLEEVAARDPDLDRALEQAREAVRKIPARGLAIDWITSKARGR
ncbi:hypothetical protein [Methylobacterium nodulans]|uniref:Uncharacterized protein n=1 Tax=Methylobacterium nodulans (strain LMG 21967 / CNCM I-2342 / ORS 2060) TaxID=460265 RepID=B8IX85_METNO|nr:hypothetical protein [Methylobacterium nodulans]ACL63126.1 hypothetical protein Mnod_8145 [Methylobacterium nodulans ORS 2060]